MHRVQVVFAAAGLAVFLVFVATISAGAQTTGDGSSTTEDGTHAYLAGASRHRGVTVRA